MSGLPEFSQPPLNEVILGVQFVTPGKYSQIFAGRVWSLFEKDYPNVEEQRPIEQQFETFGLPAVQNKIKFITGPTHDRFWFIDKSKCELVQFQADRLHHNWRKEEPAANYPRFDNMIERFKEELTTLQKFFLETFDEGLVITQCEISYINHIKSNDGRLKPSDWIKFFNSFTGDMDEVTLGSRKPIEYSGATVGRLHVDAGMGHGPNGEKVLQYQLTARGLPETPDIESAVKFLKYSREIIVNHFTDTTTPEAHISWGRTR